MSGSAVLFTVGMLVLAAGAVVAAEAPARESLPAVSAAALVPERLYGVHFNPQSAAPPGTGHWLLDYPLIRARIQRELAELVQETGANFLDIMVLIPFTLREKATAPTDTARDVAEWANLATLANLVDFLNCCHRLGVSVEIDLATNMWIPYRVDTAHHIGQSEWWPKPDETPWTEAAVWYEQIIRHVEAAVADPASIACWTLMGNYQFGGAEPVTWDWPEQPDVMAFTERFVKEVWPHLRAAATRPLGSPIMLPILADNDYWRRQTPETRLSSVRNLKRWLVDDLRLPPDYWVMSTYPCCDPATDGVHYLREIVRLLGPENASRIISTDFKGEGHVIAPCIADKAGLSGTEVLQWHFDKVTEYGFAGWWIWAYQDGETEPTGLRDRQGRWKPDLVRAIRARSARAREAGARATTAPAGPAPAGTAAAPPPPSYRLRVVPHWFAGNSRFWYRNDGAEGTREFVVVDAERGVREPAFDHAKAADALRRLTGKETSARQLPVLHIAFPHPDTVVLRGRDGTWRLDLHTYEAQIAAAGTDDGEGRLRAEARPRPSGQGGEETWITFDNRLHQAVELFWIDGQGLRHSYGQVEPGQRREQHTYARHTWLVSTAPDEPTRVFEAGDQPGTAVIEAPAPTPPPAAAATGEPADGRAWGPRSPDGKTRLFRRGDNLWLYALAGGGERALSTDGTAAAPYSVEDCWWSPDSLRLAALRTETAPVRQITLIESRPTDQLEPRLHSFDYPKPGDPIARPQPRLFDVSGTSAIPIQGEPCPNPWSIQDVRWAADSSRFTFVYNQRGHQLLQVIAVDAVSGQAHVLVDERSSTFICYSSKYFCEWIGDDELIWMSERDGWNHLWLYDARAGTVKCQITRGEWVVQGVERVDREARQIVLRAGGIHPGQDPYYTHFCRADIDGSGLATLTAGDGTHSAAWSPDGRFFIDTTSRVDLPPIHELRRGDTGALLCRLEQADAAGALAAAGRWPERFVAKGRDGQTDIFGVIIRPRGFEPQHRYPVIEDIYAGPQSNHVPKAFSTEHGQQALADRGFIIVRIDGMGTSGRSKAFHDVCWQNLRDAGLPDRIAWIRAAAAQYPEMDIERVGIYGGSAGGQNALAALLWHADFYKVAVADCGCHDNRMDKIWWNEQWLGWPVGPQYELNSNVAEAQRLRGRLLLIVGELDHNVDPASTLQVADALVRADKDFELLVLPGVGHGAAETPYGTRRRTKFFVRHLLSER